MKKAIRISLVGIFGILVAISAGCTTVNTVEPAQPVAQREYVYDKRVTTDTSLGRRVKVLGVNMATGPGGFLKIQLEVENTTRSRHSFTYRVEWFDETGIIINTPTSVSMPRSIEGREIQSITAMAPTDRAKDFRIKLLEPTR